MDRSKPPSPKDREDVQPGTGQPGRSWQSQRPDPANDDEELDEELEDSFPASDPPQSTQPGATGWDLTTEEEKNRKKR